MCIAREDERKILVYTVLFLTCYPYIERGGTDANLVVTIVPL